MCYCYVGACSVVAKDVPPYSIVAGNPAKIVRYRFPDEIVEQLLEIKWWDWD
ncbi:chloramphenicol acetyltransferase [Rickettsia rhipicephali str. 3-7-female6-CWPP]|nr:chloramphenicol acetyltransferase [Rickettsia rhipicephali str. 3-7-female6-CWPP]